MLRPFAALLLSAMPAAVTAQSAPFLGVQERGGGFLVERSARASTRDYYCRAGEWARVLGARTGDRVEVVSNDAAGVTFRVVSAGRAGGLLLTGRPGESRSVGHALLFCGE